MGAGATGGLLRPRSRSAPHVSRELRVGVILTSTAIGAVLIGTFDFLTGNDLRVYPLYYLPISAAAWWGGRPWAMTLACLCALIWVIASHLVEPHEIALEVQVINVAMQLGSFGLIGTLIASLRAANVRERELSRADALTGLLNSRGLYDEAPRQLALARRYGHPLTIAYLDLDNFKQVNDTLGHAGGDQLLRAAAQALRDGVREVDLVARLGGDEFVLLLPETDQAGAARVLERLHAELTARLKRRCAVAGASIGAVVFSRPPAELDELIHLADGVMYEVKRDHKNEVRIVSVDPDASSASLVGATATSD